MASPEGVSIFTQDWRFLLEVPAGMIDEEEWKRLFALREKVLKELENFRSKGTIGSPLEARLTIQCVDEKEYLFFESRIPLIKTLSIVSQVVVKKALQDGITVDKASGKKCQRCWLFTDDTEDIRYVGLCHKCVAVMEKSVKGV
jgi:isoleucyl-tRNA synthetase